MLHTGIRNETVVPTREFQMSRGNDETTRNARRKNHRNICYLKLLPYRNNNWNTLQVTRQRDSLNNQVYTDTHFYIRVCRESFTSGTLLQRLNREILRLISRITHRIRAFRHLIYENCS